MASALVHIGTHKTGTTAFQQWSLQHRDELLEQRDLKVYTGRFGPSHYEFALMCMRSNRTMPMKRSVPDWCLDEWREETASHIAEQVADPAEQLLVSAEALSLLRYDDEVEALAALLAPRTVRVAVCLRDPADFLASYRRQLAAAGESPSRYPSSHAYVETDTWLVEWDEMLATWRRVLGADQVAAFDYESAMAEQGSSIPGVLTALGIEADGLPSWEGVVANATPSRLSPARLRSRLHSALRP